LLLREGREGRTEGKGEEGVREEGKRREGKREGRTTPALFPPL